jgi:hypothetical protein
MPVRSVAINYVGRGSRINAAVNGAVDFVRTHGEQIAETAFYGAVLTGIVLGYTALTLITTAVPAAEYEILTRDYIVIEAANDE